jgi:hypothetical protein
VYEADIRSYFDHLNRKQLVELIRQRVPDGSLISLVGKCLHVGVLDGEETIYPDEGTAQGSILSPLLGNIYLHYVLDDWFVQVVQPRLKGKAILIRYVDDFVIGFEHEADARRVAEVMSKRMGAHGLTLHPEKTKLIPFERPLSTQTDGKGPGSFDFLGFTCIWKRTVVRYMARGRSARNCNVAPSGERDVLPATSVTSFFPCVANQDFGSL